VSSLIAALEDVKGWDRLALELDVPQSKREEIRRTYSDDTERKREVLKEWRNHHPAPNWMLVATALYRMRAASTHEVLHQLRQKYFEGKKRFSVCPYSFACCRMESRSFIGTFRTMLLVLFVGFMMSQFHYNTAVLRGSNVHS